MAHNGGIEYAISDHYYLSPNGACAWWSKLENNKVYRWMDGELAPNYCFKSQSEQCGPQVGIYIQTGEFEFMNGSKNRKGKFTSAGLSGASSHTDFYLSNKSRMVDYPFQQVIHHSLLKTSQVQRSLTTL